MRQLLRVCMDRCALLYKRLDELGITYTTYTHDPAYKVSEAQEILGDLDAHGLCKSLFLKNKKNQMYIIVALFETRIDLKEVAKVLRTRELHFASAECLQAILGVLPGSVTPFGLINDKEHIVTVVLDSAMFSCPLVGIHPMINTATTLLNPRDLRLFIESCGNKVIIVDFENLLR